MRHWARASIWATAGQSLGYLEPHVLMVSATWFLPTSTFMTCLQVAGRREPHPAQERAPVLHCLEWLHPCTMHSSSHSARWAGDPEFPAPEALGVGSEAGEHPAELGALHLLSHHASHKWSRTGSLPSFAAGTTWDPGPTYHICGWASTFKGWGLYRR